MSRLADVVRERTSASRKAEVGGVVINTCGWVRGEGYNQIKHIAQVKKTMHALVLITVVLRAIVVSHSQRCNYTVLSDSGF